jgi:hypothetical protein
MTIPGATAMFIASPQTEEFIQALEATVGCRMSPSYPDLLARVGHIDRSATST